VPPVTIAEGGRREADSVEKTREKKKSPGLRRGGGGGLGGGRKWPYNSIPLVERGKKERGGNHLPT